MICDRKIASFTLIELLIVIVIIGILSVALIPRLEGMQDRARIRAATKNMQDFNTALTLARVNDFKKLRDISGNYCSLCLCSAYVNDISQAPDTSNCVTRWITALKNISLAAGMDQDSLMYMKKDPRGSIYLLDENEGETGTGDCRTDYFYSVGPDRKRSTSDDIHMDAAPAFCPQAY